MGNVGGAGALLYEFDANSLRRLQQGAAIAGLNAEVYMALAHAAVTPLLGDNLTAGQVINVVENFVDHPSQDFLNAVANEKELARQPVPPATCQLNRSPPALMPALAV